MFAKKNFKVTKSICSICLIFFIVVAGCATSTPKNLTLMTDEGQTQVVTIGYKENPTNGYYILLENLNDSWVIKKISDDPIKQRENYNQEVLFINDSLNWVQPYFEKVKYFNGTTFECSPLLDDKKSYTPCNSNLMTINVGASIGKNIVSAVTTFGLASGTHRTVDSDKISKILTQTNLINKVKERIQQCEKQEQMVKTFKKKIEDDIIKPQIIDKSGFYDGKKILWTPTVYVKNKGKCSSLDEVRYDVKITPLLSDFLVSIDNDFYELKYSDDDNTLIPVVTIKKRQFSQIYPMYDNEDSFIRITFDRKNINFTNKTVESFLEIHVVSVYYNEKIITYTLRQPLQLPPLATGVLSPLEADILRDLEKQANYALTKYEALEKNITFGFAIKYRIIQQHIDKTLFRINTYSFYELLKDLGKV